MEKLSQKLIQNLKLDSGTPNFKRDFNFKLYPFHTRNPERAKFTNGFNPILGGIARNSLKRKLFYERNDYKIETIINNIDVVKDSQDNELDENNKENFLKRIFDYSNLVSFKHPHFINYYALSEGSEKRGEMDIAQYIVKMFKLQNNYAWQRFMNDKNSTNLVEKLLLESLEDIPVEKNDNQFMLILDDLLEVKNTDLYYLLDEAPKDFTIKNLGLFFAFYYFQYITQTALKMDRFEMKEHKLIELYFTLETEKLTSTRITVKQGYNLIKNILRTVLINENLMGYLNALIIEEDVLNLAQIRELKGDERENFQYNLKLFLNKYKEVSNKIEDIPEKMEERILLFRKWLSEDVSQETTSRFGKSIEEIGDFHFLKQRGQLGKTLTLRKDLIILLTALAVKNEKKIITDVFEEFEHRGVYLDRYTKQEILALYERMNILDKKSDSGEAIYVKPIL